MRQILFFILLSTSLIAEHCIVFVHLGKTLPSYLPIALSQARLFNTCPIYLIANKQALKSQPKQLLQSDVICVPAESLKRTREHKIFLEATNLDGDFRGGFWIFALERFFYLHEFIKAYKLENVFHLEYDNMLYADLSNYLPVLKKLYSGKMGATFDNDARCIAGFIYISKRAPLKQFCKFVVENVQTKYNDMEFLAKFKKVDKGAYIDHLPVTPATYFDDYPLMRAFAKDLNLYSNHFDEIKAIFDAAAIGQFLGGIDPIHAMSAPGFINESCLFNPSHFQYEWVKDDLERLVPMMIHKGEKWPIVNLHIHSKNLHLFTSKDEL